MGGVLQGKVRRTSDTGDRLLAGEIGDVNEGIVERSVDVGDAENELALSDLGAERDGFGGGSLGLLGGLWVTSNSQPFHPPQNASHFATSRRPAALRDTNRAAHHL